MLAIRRILSIIIVAFLAISCGGEETSKGDLLFGSGQYREAISAYTEYLKLHPNHVASYYNRGRSYEELKQYDQSFKDFKKVLELDEKNFNAHLSLSNHYYRERVYAKSLIHAKQVIELNGSVAQGYFLIARCNHQMGAVKEAMKAYDQAIELNENLGEAYLYRGALHVYFKNNSSACSDFRNAKNLSVAEADAVLEKYCK
ncbi:MAG: tetratricopeptide repeat protein [Bacteroidota bacterium]